MRCAYTYKDGAQCMSNAPISKKMCNAHTLLTQMAKDKKKNDAKRYLRNKANRPSRAKPKEKRVVKPPPQPNRLYDHTAPWKCSLEGCKKCAEKPLYDDYMRSKGA